MAPGRVNLIGEHTDYNGGFCLPIALEHTTRARVRLRSDDEVRFRSTAGDRGGEYAVGVLAAFRAESYDVPGADISVDSDVPIGAGLSSSAALECAIALAINDLVGLGLPRTVLARIAQRAENEFVGAPTGILDQSASLLCTAGHALLLDCRDQSTEQVPFDPAASGLHLLVIDTRAHHQLTDGQYGDRRDECARAARALGLGSLRDAGAADLDLLGDDLLRRRARHVITENQRVLEVVVMLRAGRLGDIGPLLTASHASLRDDYEVSCPELDVAVAAALAAGARGARMTGGGFGGSAIALADSSAAVEEEVRAAFDRHGFAAPDVFEVRPGAGARREPGSTTLDERSGRTTARPTTGPPSTKGH